LTLEDRYENLKWYQKIELVILFILLYGVILYVLQEYFNGSSDIKQNTLQKESSIDQKIKYISSIEATKSLNHILTKHNISKSSSSIQKDQISLEFSSKYQDLYSFLNELKLHFYLKSLEIKPIQEDSLKVTITLDIRYFFNRVEKYNLLKSNYENPFIYNKTKEKNLQKRLDTKGQEFKIDGIMDDEVLIEGRWYKKDESFKNNKIISIENSKVYFFNMENKARFHIDVSKE